MKKILFIVNLLLAVSAYAQSGLTAAENYIYEKNCLTEDCSKKTENVKYFDGLGRLKQNIAIKATPAGKDVAVPIEYDAYGRQVKEYLSVPQSGTQNGAVYSNLLSNAAAVYGNEKIYAEKVLEASPLERIQQQTQVGNDWAAHPVNFSNAANTSNDAVKKFVVSTSWTDGRTDNALSLSGTYPAGVLYKSSVTDEDGNVTVEFKNKKGQSVLVRKNDGTQNADTYYIYNKYGQLAYTIPPLPSKSGLTDQTTLDNLCYQYRYDSWNRLVEKKLPGKGWEYMVYDNADRLVMSQDAVMRPSGNWMFVKYDKLSRVIYTGITDVGAWFSRAHIQASVDYYIGHGQPSVEGKDQTGFTNSGMTVYYGNTVYPTTIDKILTVNYYDTYPPESPAVPVQILGQNILPQDAQSSTVSTKSLPTASYVKNVEDDNWTKNYIWYDTKGRAIGTHSINHLGGYTKTESELDFAGAVKQTKAYHKRLNTDTEKVITQTYEYDSQNRLLVHKHQVDSRPQELLAVNTYNELSQLVNKKVGNNLQSIDYAYNIKGWMTKVNDPAALNGKLFGYEIKYQNPVNIPSAPSKYGGNITQIDWRTSQDDVLKRYSYQYDGLNRLKKGTYSEPGNSVPGNDFFNEEMNYDLNGNILSLQRNNKGASGMAEQIDNLSYNYTGNRLNSVKENQPNYLGYPEFSENPISYDDNGNMTDHKDKGILEIKYNFLNLADYIKFDQTYVSRFQSEDTNVNTRYTYRADGAKLQKMYTFGLGRNRVETNRITEYLDGFQYETTVSGGRIPVQVLKFVPTAEGYYNFENNKYIYTYSDHLGNTRLSYFNNGSGAAVIEENNYYPFGLKHDAYNGLGGNTAYKYQYNNKELQEESGMYDYGWRQYMPELGRWNGIDQLAEKYLSTSPYVYVANNPVSLVDPDGRWMDEAGHINTSGYTLGFTGGKAMLSQFLGQRPGEGGGGTTIGNMMTGLGFEANGGINYAEAALGALTLREELINAGWDTPENMSAKFGDLKKLIDNVPSLRDLYNVLTNNNATMKFLEYNGSTPGLEEGHKISFNMSKIKNILSFGYTIGHEMFHTFIGDNKFAYDDVVNKRTTISSQGFQFFKEFASYTWEVNLGNNRIGNPWNYTVDNYGPNSTKLPPERRYKQNVIDFINPYKYQLSNIYLKLYQNSVKNLK
ncbi:RHS repeat-associated protein [Chryseobacterium sp. H1D6B]|uniref:DUF6443 domain-containing protein n=1 Tax=Chryseobacterium sp. H1D6B TaxID=2940588 RepID=UPI0015C86B1A|nr:DUF6443 domain-containing protein [Chryseobacterium sp. H1D6B]MDH6252579.1 RHS repeat-associated protein [Chryseobacterium sp. H1D6B]